MTKTSILTEAGKKKANDGERVTPVFHRQRKGYHYTIIIEAVSPRRVYRLISGLYFHISINISFFRRVGIESVVRTKDLLINSPSQRYLDQAY